MSVNLAQKYSPKVDERFSRDSQAMMALSNTYEFTGVDTVKVYSIPTVAMTDYSRSGASRYGSPGELQNSIQTMKLEKDRSFTFTIDRGNKIQSQMVMDAGQALARQTREVIIPEFDTHVFQTLTNAAVDNEQHAIAVASKSDAYEMFLKGQETLGNKNVPDAGRVAFCSYAFANLLKMDSSFMKYSDMSQEMLIKGVIGEVDGTKIVKVPASRLPYGASFIITHPVAAVGPKQLEDYKIHDNPPGISGWLVEGRIIYDAFVLDEKKDAVYVLFGGGILGSLTITSTAGTVAQYDTVIKLSSKPAPGFAYYYKIGASAASVTFGTALTDWTKLEDYDTAAGATINAGATGTVIQVAEVDANKKPIKVGQKTIAKKA